VQGVTSDLYGIGYSGIGYKTSGVRVVPLSNKTGEPASDGSYEDVLSGKYPLGRMLYIYVVKKPNEPLSPLVAEFIKFTLSKEGQEVVVKDGYLPLPAKVAGQQVAMVR
jgi:phosphate transport system substrate-binding protein